MEPALDFTRKALICVGTAPLDPGAIRFAEHLAHAWDLPPILLHVYTPNVGPEVGEQLLASAQEMMTSKPEQVLNLPGQFDTMVEKSLSAAQERLLILGTSRQIPDKPATQLSKKIAVRVCENVLVIRNPPELLERILICTGGHEESNTAISWGLRLAARLESESTILHVVSSMPSMYTGLNALDESLQDLLSHDTPLTQHLKSAAKMAEELGVGSKLELRHGMVTEEILRACELGDMDLVVMGAPAPGAILDRIKLGRIAPQLIASSPRSTLIVRS